eukprot:gnl/MRDRNA2_/MRDRNA2_106384_c0_seq1.p1 gnl/MRDRNA2_/MRDRNA2_106384_c0~~gnl/MRDRNA2_/MRDRNA2_106384_c0_seq1.p1  ORF type:complete len:517 (+),score=135.97 gnl/MRDRNA2_/MRDRNA2_106384_c0_seq1:125-1675(+)
MGLSESRIFGCPNRKSAGKEQLSGKPVGKGFAEPVPVRNTQPKPKRIAKNFEHSSLNSAAEEFRPPVGLYPKPEDVPSVNFGMGAPPVDPSEPEWAQFLAKKAYEKKVQKEPGTRPQRTPVQRNIASQGPPAEKPAGGGAFQLQTSEYLKLLKAGEQKAGADSKKRQVPTGSTTTMGDASGDHSMASLKSDLAGALDSIIRQQRAGQTDAQGLKNKKKTQVPLKKMLMQEKGGSKEDALLRIAQMLDIQDNNDEGLAEAEGMVSAKDDLFIEQQNRDEDLAELAYWSDDDKAPRAIHHASAHKVGHLQLKTCAPRDYVTQKLGSDLDRNVAMMLLHLRRLNDRHRSFEPEMPPRRRFVVGIKEVFRGVRHGRVKCIIVAPDIEEMTSAGGLDEKVKDILRVGYEQDVPVIFALSRVRIGRALGKSLRMSVLAVLDITGVQDLYESTIDLAFQKRVAWLKQQPELPPPEVMKEEPKGKSSNKAREPKGGKDRAGGNNQAQRRQDQNMPPGTWLPKQN